MVQQQNLPNWRSEGSSKGFNFPVCVCEWNFSEANRVLKHVDRADIYLKN